MQLRDAKVGQRVRVWVQVDGVHPSFVVIGPTFGHRLIHALILEQDSSGGRTVLGWKTGEEQPTVMLLAVRTILTAWEDQGIILAHEYGDHVECLEEENETIPSTKKDYGNECPCGIHPSKCDYHRP